MRKVWFRMIAGAVAGLSLLGGAAAVRAADLALVASGGTGGARPQLAEDLVAAYTQAGYRVIDARGADRAELIRLIGEFEREIEGTERRVVHLIGPLAESGGLTFFLPRGAAPAGLTGIIAEGLPLQLFLDLAGRGEGRGMLALGITNFRDLPAGGLTPPPGVLVVRGLPQPVNRVVVDQMLREARSAAEVDPRGMQVVLEGQVTNAFRLAGTRERSPAEREDALELTEAERLQLQNDLQVLGFEPGAADGVLGRTTREAIRDWQAANGFPETGYLTAAQAEAIAAAADATRDDLRAATAALRGEQTAWDAARQADTIDAYAAFLAEHPEGRFAGEARDRKAELEEKIEMARRLIEYRDTEQSLALTLASGAVVEQRLGELGYDAGPADGRFDRQTRRALAAFQESRGLEPSGYVNTVTLQQLIIAGAGE